MGARPTPEIYQSPKPYGMGKLLHASSVHKLVHMANILLLLVYSSASRRKEKNDGQ